MLERDLATDGGVSVCPSRW